LTKNSVGHGLIAFDRGGIACAHLSQFDFLPWRGSEYARAPVKSFLSKIVWIQRDEKGKRDKQTLEPNQSTNDILILLLR